MSFEYLKLLTHEGICIYLSIPHNKIHPSEYYSRLDGTSEEEAISILGLDGWEMCGLFFNPKSFSTHYWFKRMKHE